MSPGSAEAARCGACAHTRLRSAATRLQLKVQGLFPFLPHIVLLPAGCRLARGRSRNTASGRRGDVAPQGLPPAWGGGRKARTPPRGRLARRVPAPAREVANGTRPHLLFIVRRERQSRWGDFQKPPATAEGSGSGGSHLHAQDSSGPSLEGHGTSRIQRVQSDHLA